MKKINLGYLISLLLLHGCSSTPETHISQTELLIALEKKPPPIIVDVRSTSEYQSGHIKGALHIPFYQIFHAEKLMQYNKQRCLILYCEHGPRAGLAKIGLKIGGFNCIRYLKGHLKAWKKAQLPLEK